jgi:large subunit ribosomal protein L13e
MVKHNNVVPNIHCKKKWHDSTRGPLKVKLSLDQASKKKSRRLARAAKAAAIAPRPLQLLRPVVNAQTQRYSSKLRIGQGFTIAELKAAGFSPAYARTVGIAVDPRRSNRSVETMERNVARLSEYKAKLIVFPKRRGSAKAGDASKDESAAATQSTGVLQPIVKPVQGLVMAEVTAEMKSNVAFTQMRLARMETKVEGLRVSVQNRKKKD